MEAVCMANPENEGFQKPPYELMKDEAVKQAEESVENSETVQGTIFDFSPKLIFLPSEKFQQGIQDKASHVLFAKQKVSDIGSQADAESFVRIWKSDRIYIYKDKFPEKFVRIGNL